MAVDPKKPKKVIIFTHGLAGSAFNTTLATEWIDAKTAVITFSNRGHDNISKLRRITNTKKGFRSYPGGMAHEVFTESADDLQGVINFVKQNGVTEVYLAGHSTGCQKSVFYASKKNADKVVKGLILLAPISDYADAQTFDTDNKLAKTTKIARKFVKEGEGGKLIPDWIYPVDAQRFLSLCTPESKEEIFCYAQPNKKPSTLKSVRVPMLMVFAGDDEYADRPMQDIADWFEGHVGEEKNNEIMIVPKVLHSFKGGQDEVARSVKRWVNKLN